MYTTKMYTQNNTYRFFGNRGIQVPNMASHRRVKPVPETCVCGISSTLWYKTIRFNHESAPRNPRRSRDRAWGTLLFRANLSRRKSLAQMLLDLCLTQLLSRTMSQHDDEDYKLPAAFEGNVTASNISLVDDDEEDYEEETTRRIGAVSFEPFAAPPSFAATVDVTQQKASTSVVSPVTRSTSKGPWQLSKVPTLPEYHPLERTAVFVPNAESGDVASRISGVLRDRSIEAEYDDDKAKVKCLTAEGVDFRVRLYRGRGAYSHGIIVEVQRRFGASTNFHADTMAILDAAEGKTPVPPPPTLSTALPMVSDVEDDYQASGSSSLTMVGKMLDHAAYDSQYLAFQTLIPLTDSSKMGRSTSRSVSKALLTPGHPVGTKIVALVMGKNDVEDMFKLRTMAMTVLANAIQAVKGDIDMSLREEIRPMLMNELRTAATNPRCAQMAAVAVEYLLAEDHEAEEFYAPLETALEAGTARHAGLMRQAQRCLDKLH